MWRWSRAMKQLKLRSGNMDAFALGRLTCRHHFFPIARSGNQIGRGRGRCAGFGRYRNRQMIHGLVPAATPWPAPRSLCNSRDKRTNREKLTRAFLLVIHPIVSSATTITIAIVTSATSTWTARVFYTDSLVTQVRFFTHRQGMTFHHVKKYQSHVSSPPQFKAQPPSGPNFKQY